MTRFEPTKLEPELLKWWEENKIYEKLKNKLAKAPKYMFLDGPPYTTGAIHVGNAWNYMNKDCYRRFLRMTGHNVHDQPGFDTHGLPIEHKVEQKLGIKNKQEIVSKIGVERFVKECEKYAYDNMYPMIKDFQRLGVWMDWKNPYMTLKNEYIEGAWWALKKAWQNGYLYQGLKSTTWCPRCATALAKHELEYETVTDTAIFVKFPVAGKRNEFLIVWTTTPWTIPFNLAVMANPNFDYAKAKVDGEIWIVAKDLSEKVLGLTGKKFKVLETLKGKELEGLQYEHPLTDEIPALKEHSKLKWAHKVAMSEKYVSAADGSGLVHTAPGCGPEDFEVGQQHGLPAFNELDEHGYYSEKMGPFAGLRAKYDDDKFIKEFDKRGMLTHKDKYEHEYAKCWRCATPVVYRATKQWFLARTKLKDLMLKENSKVYWTPDWAGQRWFESWLENLEDWNISRQRFWGIPLPIWLCSKCDNMLVAESAAELKKLGGKVPDDLHKPWIDSVMLKCGKCKSSMSRVPDVLDVWLDSGAAPWASTGDKELVVDFIGEGKDQIRGWFNSLMSLSIVARKKAPYKSVFMHGFINDSGGRKMSKHLGNVISPYEVVDKYGADAARFYAIGGAKPGLDLNYNFADVEVKLANLNVLWNTHLYLIEAAKTAEINPSKIKAAKLEAEDKYMLSRLNSTIIKATEAYNKHFLNEVPWTIESLFLDLSRWYIKTVRERVGEEAVLYVIYRTLMDSMKMLATITPYITETIYQNLKREFKLKDESIHLMDWPEANNKMINEKLEAEIVHVQNILSNLLSLREKLQRGIRWPIKTATVVTENEELSTAVQKHSELLKRLANVLEIKAEHKLAGIKHNVKTDFSKIGPKFGKDSSIVVTEIARMSPESVMRQLQKDGKVKVQVGIREAELEKNEIIIEEILPENLAGGQFGNYSLYLEKLETPEMQQSGFAREFTRAVQALRKKAGLQKADKIDLYVAAAASSQKALQANVKEIKKKVGASDVNFVAEKVAEARKHKDKIRARNFEAQFGF
jgi:isoleucyl-tRNA synthetase